MIGSCSNDCTICVWDIDTEECKGKLFIKIGVLKGHEHPVTCFSFSPCDYYICSGSEDKSLYLWDLRSF